MKRLRFAFLACALLAVLSINGSAQQSAALRVSGSVSHALRLTVGGPASRTLTSASASVQATVYEQGSEQLVVALSAPGQTGPLSISIPIEVRTNVAYELLAASTTEGCAPILAAHVESLRASGPQTANEAVERARFNAAPATIDPIGAALLDGPRVSKAGNFSTPTNALLVNLVVQLSEAPQPSCAWRATLRLSLRPLTANP
ncbi:MAG TPA: hypothetical protein VJ464_28535 [Blastocatellia bacterium]|nr:hypothetical protein [Blastocatellia bacterium]